MVRIIRLSKKGFCNHPHGGRLWVLKPGGRANPALTLASFAFLFPNWFSGMDFPEFTLLGSFSQPWGNDRVNRDSECRPTYALTFFTGNVQVFQSIYPCGGCTGNPRKPAWKKENSPPP